MKLSEFNSLPPEKAEELLMDCCGSEKWAALMVKKLPFSSVRLLWDNATRIWYEECSSADWNEALRRHPKIGDILLLTKKLAEAAKQAGKESEMNESSEEMLRLLKFANEEYEKQNGFIFVYSASGKSSGEILRQLTGRLFNSRDEEMDIAMGEQHKITLIRLMRSLESDQWNSIPGSHISISATNVVDGKPARGITVRLKDCWKGSWQTIAQGETNAGGMINDLLPPGKIPEDGNYQLVFETGDYFKDNRMEGLYPQVDIIFTLSGNAKCHIPLNIGPDGFSTQRASG